MEPNSYVEDDDSDSDLPEINFSPSCKTGEGYDVDSIIWAKWKRQFWPALVRMCDLKHKKLSIVYVDLPLKENGQEHRFTIQFRNVMRFDSSEKSSKLMESGLAGDDPVLTKAIEAAKNYVIQKGVGGFAVSSVQFLADPLSDFLAKNLPRCREKSRTEKTRRDDCAIAKDAKKRDLSESFDECSEKLAESESPDEESPLSYHRIDPDVRAKMFSVIKSDECKNHMLKILREEEESTYRVAFLSSKKRKKIDFSYQGLMTPSQVEEITNYMKPLVTNTSRDPLYSVNYIMDVLTPEALVFALQAVLKMTKSKAQDILSGEDWTDELNKKFAK